MSIYQNERVENLILILAEEISTLLENQAKENGHGLLAAEFRGLSVVFSSKKGIIGFNADSDDINRSAKERGRGVNEGCRLEMVSRGEDDPCEICPDKESCGEIQKSKARKERLH